MKLLVTTVVMFILATSSSASASAPCPDLSGTYRDETSELTITQASEESGPTIYAFTVMEGEERETQTYTTDGKVRPTEYHAEKIAVTCEEAGLKVVTYYRVAVEIDTIRLDSESTLAIDGLLIPHGGRPESVSTSYFKRISH